RAAHVLLRSCSVAADRPGKRFALTFPAAVYSGVPVQMLPALAPQTKKRHGSDDSDAGQMRIVRCRRDRGGIAKHASEPILTTAPEQADGIPGAGDEIAESSVHPAAVRQRRKREFRRGDCY